MDWDYYIVWAKKNAIGLVVLLIGLIAVLFVTFKAVDRYGGEGTISQEEINTFKQTPAEQAARSRTRQPEAKRYETKEEIKESDFRGAWQADLDDGVMLIQLQNGIYKMVIVPDDQNGTRYYSNGHYAIKGSVLIFTPDFSMPAPKSDYYTYNVLTRSSFPVSVATPRGKVIFQKPIAADRVYVPNNHPLLARGENNLVVLTPLK